jgi:hypothetical protein
MSCRNQARKIGKPFPPLHIRRRNFLAKCAAAETALQRRENEGKEENTISKVEKKKKAKR